MTYAMPLKASNTRNVSMSGRATNSATTDKRRIPAIQSRHWSNLRTSFGGVVGVSYGFSDIALCARHRQRYRGKRLIRIVPVTEGTTAITPFCHTAGWMGIEVGWRIAAGDARGDRRAPLPSRLFHQLPWTPSSKRQPVALRGLTQQLTCIRETERRAAQGM